MNKKISLPLLVAVIVILFAGGYFAYQNLSGQQNTNNQTTDWKTYANNEYGFQMTFLDSWKGYSVIKDSWTGHKLDGSESIITGSRITFRNPNWTSQKHYQDIPVMVFTPDQWSLVEQEKIGVSAAPIGPSKIGQNQNYVFATPPRWYGFTDDIGWQEAVEIVKTFKAIQ